MLKVEIEKNIQLLKNEIELMEKRVEGHKKSLLTATSETVDEILTKMNKDSSRLGQLEVSLDIEQKKLKSYEKEEHMNSMKISFLSNEHEKLFYKMRQQIKNESYRKGKEYLSVVFLIAGNDELNQKVSPYFDTTVGMFDSEAMFKNESFSHGLSVLARLAVNLFNDNEKVTPLELIGVLDDEKFNLALNAIILRKNGISSSYECSDEKLYM
ncbi:MAG: DUF6075 family protein [Bacillota bacterium]|nr:DUF6075 family protein [Bacillota bacterium]